MPDVVALVVMALAVARVTGLVVSDEITKPARQKILDSLDDRERTLGASAGYLLTCPWCASVWIAAVAAPLVWWHWGNPWLMVPALVAAFSQVAGMTAQIGRGD